MIVQNIDTKSVIIFQLLNYLVASSALLTNKGFILDEDGDSPCLQCQQIQTLIEDKACFVS